MNERFIRKQLFQIGQFYQMDAFNPVYLDKTGELISQTEGVLKDWNGNADEFHFSDEQGLYKGKVSPRLFWYSNTKQDNFDDNELKKFKHFIISTNEKIDSVYKPKYYKRIGFRIQYILKKTGDHIKYIYNNFYKDKFVQLSKFGNFKTSSIGFDIESNNQIIRVNINYVIRKTNNEENSPKEGLLFDLDFFKILNKIEKTEAFEINEYLLTFVEENYKGIICNIAKEMGAIDEN